jgi:hypothetical protein
LIGWLWYSPMLFGKKWAEGMGVEMGSASDMPVNAMALQAIGLLLVSWFVGVTSASYLLTTVIVATVALTVLQLSGGMFGKQSTYARNSNAGYWIVAVAVMIVAQGIF